MDKHGGTMKRPSGKGYFTTGGNKDMAPHHTGHETLIGGLVPKHHRGSHFTHHSDHSEDGAIPGHKDGHFGNQGHSVNNTHKMKNHAKHHHGAFRYHGGGE